ncbi:MAG: dCTP deaminase [Candidatus Bilamarchaeaceae archaeon]
MILSDDGIRKAMMEGKLKIRPFRPDQLGQATVDLTLGKRFWFFKERYAGGVVDLSKVNFKEATKEVRADSVVLAPAEMCLGISVERLTLSPSLMGRLEGRSKYARMGLAVHITSAVVQPGSDNHQVFEILNNAPFPIMLHSGMRISQVVFYRLESPTSKPYAKYGKVARKQ